MQEYYSAIKKNGDSCNILECQKYYVKRSGTKNIYDAIYTKFKMEAKVIYNLKEKKRMTDAWET